MPRESHNDFQFIHAQAQTHTHVLVHMGTHMHKNTYTHANKSTNEHKTRPQVCSHPKEYTHPHEYIHSLEKHSKSIDFRQCMQKLANKRSEACVLGSFNHFCLEIEMWVEAVEGVKIERVLDNIWQLPSLFDCLHVSGYGSWPCCSPFCLANKNSKVPEL